MPVLLPWVVLPVMVLLEEEKRKMPELPFPWAVLPVMVLLEEEEERPMP
jgi:hypothetical protein